MIREDIKKYIEENIFPIYSKNDLGHDINHILYVIDRSLMFAKEVEDINIDMVYTVASYHDIGHHIDSKNHEIVSSDILRKDMKLKDFFNEEEINIMADAVSDHRASLEGEPRSIYGKIVSSADRNVEIDLPLKRTYEYRKNNCDSSLDEIITESRLHLLNKFGKKGYANEKMYFEDLDYKSFLEEITKLVENEKEFRERYIKVNNLELEIIKESLKKYIPYDEQEEMDKEVMLDFIDSSFSQLSRENKYGHFTASAFVVNEDLTKTLLVHHNIFGGYIYPGGHADNIYDLYSVAVREVMEETGVEALPYIDKNIFSIGALPIKGHIKNGKYVPAHIHYDILYLLVVKNKDVDKIRVLETENSVVKWVDLEDCYNTEAVDFIRPINEKIVRKIRGMK